MKKFFSVGQSQVHANLSKDFQTALDEDICSISNRGAKFKHLYQQIKNNLNELLNLPEGYKVLFYSSATECMERIIQSVVIEKSFHFINGPFAKRSFNISEEYDKICGFQEIFPEKGEWFDWNKAFTAKPAPAASLVNKLLYKNSYSSVRLADSELACLTMVEQANGCQLIYENIKKLKLQFPKVLIAVDLVAAVPVLKLDFKYIDFGYFCVQKMFGLPAGLAVLIVSPQAIDKINNIYDNLYNYHSMQPGSYFSLKQMLDESEKNQTPQTPNILGIYLLNQRLIQMLNTGVKKIREISDQKKDLIYSYFEQHPNYEFYTKLAAHRSETIVTLNSLLHTPAEIVNQLKEKGFIISPPYSSMQGKQIRIANFPTTTLADVQALLAEFDNLVVNKKTI